MLNTRLMIIIYTAAALLTAQLYHAIDIVICGGRDKTGAPVIYLAIGVLWPLSLGVVSVQNLASVYSTPKKRCST